MITIKDLYKSYGHHKVLRGLTLTINQGEILVILGRSGVGKSVLLKHIIGLSKPDSGTIDVFDRRITDMKQKEIYKSIKDMGMLFQGAALFDSMNIGENTAFYLNEHGNPDTGKPYSKEEIRDKVAYALSVVGLKGTEEKMPSDLSGGMRKRAALARLIVYRPKILLYDEPTTGLDPITSGQINELIVTTQRELKGTSIVVTHDMHSALYIADRLALHSEGKIAYVDVPEKFLEIDDPIISSFKDSLYNHPRAQKE